MSYYLCFKKGGKNIINFCRCTELYGCFPNAPWDEWKQVTVEELKQGRETCQDKISITSRQIEKYEKLLNGLTDYEDRANAIDLLTDYEDALDELRKVLVQIDMLISICEEKQTIHNTKEDCYEEESLMEWGIF